MEPLMRLLAPLPNRTSALFSSSLLLLKSSAVPIAPSKTSSRSQFPTLNRSFSILHRLHQENVAPKEETAYDRAVAENKDRQYRAPWHRDGSDKPLVASNRSAGAMTKGKLLTTPARLFKLVLPLTTQDYNTDRKDIEPLALLVHPQQPLSYLERLIQAELPPLTADGRDKIREVNFRALDSADNLETHPDSTGASANDVDGRENFTHTHLRPNDNPQAARELRGAPGQGGVESYSGLGHERKPEDAAANDPSTDHPAADNADPSSAEFVRWSKSTEIGDFVRDAARGRQFTVEIEGAPYAIAVGVPSFGDRTYYLRLRLRKTAAKLSSMAAVKRECDEAAHRGAQRVAYAGFGAIVGWAGVVGWLTFMTNLGWDTMEPVTYLVGLVGILGGYLWFLLNRREASYAAAMNLTVSRRQNRLYEERGFDLQRYRELVDEGNALRKEIRRIADEYDVEWDERRDAKDEKVVETLRRHRQKGGKKGKGKDDDDDDDDDDD